MNNIFYLNDSVQINFYMAKSRDFYKLLVSKTHTRDQTGPTRWSENLSINKESWPSIFKSLKVTYFMILFMRYRLNKGRLSQGNNWPLDFDVCLFVVF